jgi:hypothetical protein
MAGHWSIYMPYPFVHFGPWNTGHLKKLQPDPGCYA